MWGGCCSRTNHLGTLHWQHDIGFPWDKTVVVIPRRPYFSPSQACILAGYRHRFCSPHLALRRIAGSGEDAELSCVNPACEFWSNWGLSRAVLFYKFPTRFVCVPDLQTVRTCRRMSSPGSRRRLVALPPAACRQFEFTSYQSDRQPRIEVLSLPTPMLFPAMLHQHPLDRFSQPCRAFYSSAFSPTSRPQAVIPSPYCIELHLTTWTN